MRLSFGLKIGLFIGLVLISCAYLGIGYVGAISEYDAIKGQINMTLRAIQRASEGDKGRTLEELRLRIDELRHELNMLQSIYPRVIDRTKVIRELLELAESCGLNVLLVSASNSYKKTDERSYPLVSICLQVVGPYSRILDFLVGLEGSPPETRQMSFRSLCVDNVSLSLKGDASMVASSEETEDLTVLNGLASHLENYEGRIAISVYGMPEPVERKNQVSATKLPSRTR